MSNNSNYVNISDLPVIPEIAPGDYFVVKTPQGQALIDYVDLPFTTVSGNNVTIFGSLSSDSLTVSTSISAASEYITQIYVNGVSGLNTTGNYNTFDIRSGIIVDAGNTTSDYIISLSATTDTKLNAVSAAVPKIFTDSGIVYINASVAAPSFSEVCIGNNDVPQNLFIQPDDVNIQYLFNAELDQFLLTNYLSSIPMVYVEENVSNSYTNSNSKIQFRAVFRPPLKSGARVAWNIAKIYSS
jgi:hypothetical protein